MICDDLAKGINILVAPISTKDILILGGGNGVSHSKMQRTDAYIYDAINNTVKPQSKL